ncbi:MAG: sulfurtransferase-like selenium metabolism protein YedF [Kiritimatiellaeota bacterium]|nr:sulfurtransferase-like selenium metabolism protein YedF [Kiritimatiellota bacterium]
MRKIIIVNSERMGHGDDALGARLMGSFLRKLCNEKTKPEKMLFYNSGVKLLAEGSTVLDAIELLAKSGVELIACGSCVHHYKLENKIEPGMIGDMKGIISEIMAADTVTTI